MATVITNGLSLILMIITAPLLQIQGFVYSALETRCTRIILMVAPMGMTDQNTEKAAASEGFIYIM